jgi:formamidopyrimidine-DNA glycosylase
VPELPEVETVRRGLAGRVAGRTVERVEVGRERSVRRTSKQQVIDGLTGAKILAADRRGKYLLCPLDTGDTMMVHLRMSGQLLLAPAGAPRPAHTHVVLALSGAPEELWFVDPRTFGEVVVFDPDHVDVELPELASATSTPTRSCTPPSCIPSGSPVRCGAGRSSDCTTSCTGSSRPRSGPADRRSATPSTSI